MGVGAWDRARLDARQTATCFSADRRLHHSAKVESGIRYERRREEEEKRQRISKKKENGGIKEQSSESRIKEGRELAYCIYRNSTYT